MFAAGTITEKSSLVKDALSKIDLFVALAPVAYVHHLESKDVVLLAHSRIIEKMYRRGIYEFLPFGPISSIAPTICRMIPEGCHIFLRTIAGPTQNLNDSRLQVYVSETPAGTSLRNIEHWQQGVLREVFAMYDYGNNNDNQQHYGQNDPPSYDLSKFVLNVALFTGTNDFLADPKDVKQLISELPANRIVFQDNQVSFVFFYHFHYSLFLHICLCISFFSLCCVSDRMIMLI
jgi:hypothetical protein